MVAYFSTILYNGVALPRNNMAALVLFALLLFIMVNTRLCDHGGGHWCPATCYRQEQYTVSCGWIFRRRCNRYRSVGYACQLCCQYYAGQNCEIPQCGGGFSSTSCHLQNEGEQIYRDWSSTTIERNSGGNCVAPFTCRNCNYGYHPASDGFCRKCFQIPNCNLKQCDIYDKTVCDRCDGEWNRDRKGSNAFTGKPDNTQCQRACSWRSGFRCFPGTCMGDMIYARDCKCSPGFGGPNCDTATEERLPQILIQNLMLQGEGNIKKTFIDIPTFNGKFWTNEPQWKNISISVKSTYKPEIDTNNIPPYILNYTIGMDNINVVSTLKRQNDASSITLNQPCGFQENCATGMTGVALQNTPWNTILQGGFPKPFVHQDLITFSVYSKNGGYVDYIDWDNNKNIGKYLINGITATNTLELGFDMISPNHCYEIAEISQCTFAPLLVKDYIKEANTTVEWGDWEDNDSGIHQIVFNIHSLAVKDTSNPILEYKNMLPEIVLNYTKELNSQILNFYEPGPYAVEIAVIDLAGNIKSARRIVMFDDISKVDLQGTPVKLVEANEHFWINRYSESLRLTWNGRFINRRHHSNKWLSEVKELDYISTDLEDTAMQSKRSINAIHNINGTVRVDIGYLTELNNESLFTNFTSASLEEFDKQRRIFTEELVDGKRITYVVRGVDCMEEYAEENVTVMIDLSPPVINNLWLTKGDVLNISVHSVVELHNLTIEWEVYDVHSGVYEVFWRIFDNFTKIEIVHGKSHESIQGDTQTLQDCANKYGSYPRGHNCYCTPYNGCYHRHYQIKPQITNTTNDGLHVGKEIGVHDYDYFIEVTVINNARLNTTIYKKITIDTSPPHEGVVHDGIPGQPEVDFQQSLMIHAYWNDFFDKESGVWFYMYGFSDHCLSEEDLNVHSTTNKNVSKSYDLTASFVVPSPGKYYATVMAYNHALDHSKPVCSDGVTVESTVIEVSEVVVKGAITAKGLIQDTSTQDVYVLYENREIELVIQPTADCIQKATRVSQTDISLLPHRRLQNGTESQITLKKSCDDFINIHSSLPAYITTTGYLEVSWNSSGNVHDYEVGLSSGGSEIPDLMTFQSSHHHQHIRLYHPNIFNGDVFHIVIKAVSRSSVQSIRTAGPFAVDSTAPDVNGQIILTVETTNNGTYLIASWAVETFEDHGDPNRLIYEVAIGTTMGGKDVMPFQPLSAGGHCTITVPPTCTAISTSRLQWHLHGVHTYYVSVKAKNTVGLSAVAVSDKYFHNVEKATVGVVYDIDGDSDIKFVDIDDIDIQTRKDQLSVRWSGFSHPHESITFIVCLTKSSVGPYIACSNEITSATWRFTFTRLTLELYTPYYQIVIAHTEAGNVTAVSDGITVVVENDTLLGVYVYDGPICNNTGNLDLNVNTLHHSEDKRLTCTNDVDYQMSTNRLQAHWVVPEEKQHYLKDFFWAIEERAPVADLWTLYRPFELLKTFSSQMEVAGLHLSPGRKYRTLLKFCAGQYCFEPARSNGFTCIPNQPTVGNLRVIYHENTTSIDVAIEPFRDSDMEDIYQSLDVMDHYEWALVDSADNEKLITKWEKASTTKSHISDELLFSVPLKNKITFTKCWKLSVRGYTKAGSSAEATAEIRNCSELQQVRPAVVLDAKGFASDENTHSGKPIFLEENNRWDQADIDFTPFGNIISAVWPTLRYKNYSWAVLIVAQDDPTTFYEDLTYFGLNEPCSHPDALKCGQTENEYINVEFGPGELAHGMRYTVCIHANATIIEHEFWKQELAEVNACSDGVTVDLTPPLPADVWIGYDKSFLYQTSTSEMTVNWNSFIDVEEGGKIAHSSGIAGYEVAIDTLSGGTDIKPFTKVGLVNHKTFHRLSLQSGHSYFAIVKATDFTGQTSESVSQGVKLDTSHPVVTEAAITINSRHVTDTSFVDACWSGVFSDDESGISHYSWAVGTQKGYEDTMAYIVTTEQCGRTPENLPLTLKEGHAYFINVKGFNKAGLYSMASSWAFTVDASPPVPGVVCDGPLQPKMSCNDVDYLENSSLLNVHWTDFYEPHSSIMEYYISVGSCNDCNDVITKQPVGIRNEIELTWLNLAQGERYFVTVTACNTAEMCSSSTSDGVVVDSTPPIPGVVIDGTEDSDIQYQCSLNHLGCKWYGFTDPQSGISHYVWRVGTSKGGDNILVASDVHKEEEAFVFDLQARYGTVLPVQTKIYCTVRAYNNAGKYVDSYSNGFIVDNTPPVFLDVLKLSPIGSIVQGTSVLRSTLKVFWKVQDNESSIETQYLSISSHIGGDFNLSSTKIEGIVRDYTFTHLDLHDGSYYDVTLFSCNGAKLCTTSRVTNVLVDNTAPTPGTFAINTDHAANLARQPEDWMTWTSISISLAWLGFEDVHTGIEKYIVNVGSSYMNNDLNEIRYTPMIVNHSTNVFYLEDGFVQTQTFRTRTLTKYKSIYVSVRAINKVGLSSDIVHSQFNLLFDGMLDLVRRCDSHTCLGHCVCAPHGQLCKVQQEQCNDRSGNGNQSTNIEVKDYLDLTFPSNYLAPLHTPDNTLLAAKWYITQAKGLNPQWFEWSVGECSHDSPAGIFDKISERIWHDSGKQQQWIFTIKRGKVLEENDKYSFFVRVWYDENTYAIFKSPGVVVYSNQPSSTSLGGKAVKEVLTGKLKDLDFFRRETQVNADWTGKFLNPIGSLSHFHVYISTSPGGHDTHILAKDLSPGITSFNMTGLNYNEKTRYFTVVQAYNLAGLHLTECSDGFMLDLQQPNSGIVHHGYGLSDIKASNNTNAIQLRWHGFSDAESGIQSYRYCVFVNMADCDIGDMVNVGIATRAEFISANPFPQGIKVKGGVQAIDAAGYVSDIAISNDVIIDITPPVRVKTIQCHMNIIIDPSFENAVENDTQCYISNTSWTVVDKSCVRIVRSGEAQDGSSVLHLQGSISQTVAVEDIGKYRLTFYTSTIPSGNLHLSTTEGYIDVNNERFVFLMYKKQNSKSYSWQKHTFYFHLASKLTRVLLGTVSTLSTFALDSVLLEQCIGSTTDVGTGTNHVDAHSVFVHDWSSLHAEWVFTDNETEIVDYSWAIGTVRGGTQLQDFTSVGKKTFANINSLRMKHNTNVFVTVVAENAAGLRAASYSDPIMIDLTPPNFIFVHDGPSYDQDQDYQRELQLISHWNVEDAESGIKECSWAIGASPGDVSMQQFTKVDVKSNNASHIFNTRPQSKVFVTVRCMNGAGLTNTGYSDGITILQEPPSTDDVIFELMTSSETQFRPRGAYHGNRSEIKFRWTGFSEEDGIGSYMIALDGDAIAISEIVKGSTFGFTYASFTGLRLNDGKYTVTLTRINEVKLSSKRVSADFYLLTAKPKLTGTAIRMSYFKNPTRVTASWRDVFVSDHPLYYEVTARLVEGGEGDIVQWQETTNTHIDIDLFNVIASESGATIHFSVRAVNYAGLFETQYGDIFVTN